MSDRRPIRVALDEAAFRQLCAGKAVELVPHQRGVHGVYVELILSDIGLVRALQAVLDGMGAGHNTGLSVTRGGDG